MDEEARLARILSTFEPERREFVRDLLALRNASGRPLSRSERVCLTTLFHSPFALLRDFSLYEGFIIAPRFTVVRALQEAGWNAGPPTPEQLATAISIAAAAVLAEQQRYAKPKTVRPDWDTDD